MRALQVHSAWLAAGDFNNVLQPEERTGGSVPQVQEYGPLVDCLSDCGLKDLRSRGRVFMWSNGTIRSKIDRAIGNTQWIHDFPQI